MSNKLTPFDAEIPVTDSPSQVTLEGISGMVVMNTSKPADSSLVICKDEEDDDVQRNVEGPLQYNEFDIKKGESGATSSSSSDRQKASEG